MKKKSLEQSTGATRVKPKKRLGQNFLSEAGVIEKLVGAAQIRDGQAILEIGPGTGNLTARLLETGNKIIAIEKDPEMIDILKERFTNQSNFELHNADILKFDESGIQTPYKIAANLPFYLGAPLIRKFLESGNPPISMTVILQKEVAQRICAKPPQMNLLAISIQFYAKAEIISYISKGCFWPIPKVDCAILRITLKEKIGYLNDKDFISLFFKIVKSGFSHPRKQLPGNLSNSLKTPRQEIIKWMEANNIKPSCRAENISIDDWKMMADSVKIYGINYNNVIDLS